MTNLTPGTGKCAVIGYGSWATAIVKVLSERGIEVRWYIRNPDVLESLRTTGRNCKYLRDVKFDISRLVLSDDINATVAEADTVVLAVPSAFLKVFLQPLEVPLRDKFVISAVKGIIPDEYQTVIDYVTQRYGLNEERTGIITGPSHAEEVGREGLSYLTAVCPDERRAHEFGAMFATDYIRLSYSTDYAQLAGAKYVIEAVPERLDLKQATFKQIDANADEGAVLLTNTSGIDIDEIAAATSRPESVLGMHFFYPAPVMKLVEIIRGAQTSDEAYEATRELAEAIMILSNVWLNPLVHMTDASGIRNRCATFNRLLAGVGIPQLLDDDMVERYVQCCTPPQAD